LDRRSAIRLAVAALLGAGLIGLVVWLLTRTDELATLRGHDGPVRAVAISADGTLIASAGDGTVRIWDSSTNRERHSLAHGAKVRAIAFGTDTLLASVGDDAVVRLWNASTGEAAGTRTGPKKMLECVAISPDGSLLAAAGVEGPVHIWSGKQDGSPRSLTGHLKHVHAMLFTPDGKTLITGGEDGNLRFWDAATGSLVGNIPADKRHIHNLAVSADGKLLYAAVSGKGVKRWTLPDRKELTSFEAAGMSRGVAVSSNGRTLATVHEDGAVKLWDADSGSLVKELTGHKKVVLSVSFSMDGTFATAGGDGTVKRWKGK
jgi:WD40 repeat protein